MNHIFLIRSDSSGHQLSVDGQEIGIFATLELAEAMATNLARRFVPGATLTFELDFKWTLSDLEIRAATLECSSGPDNRVPNRCTGETLSVGANDAR